MPWKLIADPENYFLRWLLAYSALLGGVGGILIADYFVIRGKRLDLSGLYRREGPYWYSGGFNILSLIALAVGIAPCVPGFLGTLELATVPQYWMTLYHYAWFISFAVAFAVYWIAMSATGAARGVGGQGAVSHG